MGLNCAVHNEPYMEPTPIIVKAYYFALQQISRAARE
jgi:hypothetical protein